MTAREHQFHEALQELEVDIIVACADEQTLAGVHLADTFLLTDFVV